MDTPLERAPGPVKPVNTVRCSCTDRRYRRSLSRQLDNAICSAPTVVPPYEGGSNPHAQPPVSTNTAPAYRTLVGRGDATALRA
ncbi:hypothetical protein AB0C34_14945 [Nocardia sp. NPDC049220]|uniref:hypothetical protein n=1 Tax=Nocardia sp. NPDC049220 TaxID=3155273 RepID=UPI0033D54443